MKQIITQHGWGLNKYFWDDYKVDFLKNNWHWQDNERGYFSTNNYQAKWIESDSKKEIRMTLCHSFCLLYTSPSPRDRQKSRMPSSA